MPIRQRFPRNFPGPGAPPWNKVGATNQPAFQNSWTVVDSLTPGPAFYKDASGYVHLRGRMKGGASGSVAFTLPAGYRPQVEAGWTAGDTYAAAGYPGTANANAAFLYITPDGQCAIYFNGVITDVGLAGITFYAGE